MVVIVFKTGQRMEIPEGADVSRRGGLIVVRDWFGAELAAFNVDDLESFGIESEEAQVTSDQSKKRRYVRREPPRRRH
jgi:hypothetical protein